MRREQATMDGHYTEAGVAVRRNRRRWSVPDYAMQWAESTSGVEGTTRRKRLSHARQIAKHWAHLMVDEYDRPAVKEYMAHLERSGLAPGARRARFVVISQMSREAMTDKLRDDDPTMGVEPPPNTTLRRTGSCPTKSSTGRCERPQAGWHRRRCWRTTPGCGSLRCAGCAGTGWI